MKLAGLERSIRKAASQVKDRAKESDYSPGVQQAIAVITENPDHPHAQLINERITLMQLADLDPAFKAEVMKRCKDDPVYWINYWAWTQDPRRSPATIPFKLFPKQEEFIHWLQDRYRIKEDGLVEKSRDAGLSWLCIAYAAHQWLFVPGTKVTFGSRKSMLVDKLGQPDSLFEKIRILLANLPKWMLPKSYVDICMQFVNGDNGNSITGEAGDNCGRGGRSSIYFLDEFAFVERANKVDAAVSENSDCKIYVSTPNGNGNTFAKKRFSGQYPVFRIHWTDDPRKGPEWYAKRKATLDPVILAQEIDIDYSASVDGVTIPNNYIMAAVGLKLPAVGRRIAGLDVAESGKCKNVFIVRHGPVVQNIEVWAGVNTTETAYRAKEFGEKYRIKHLNYDANGVGAGVAGTLKTCEGLKFSIEGIKSGIVTDTKWPEFDNKNSKDLFVNRRAEDWWMLRRRFEKTYEYVNGIKDHPVEELISIPNCAELISQLSQPLRRFNDAGKIAIESKDQMEKRGIDSPDYADALVYAFSIGHGKLDWLAKA